MKKRIISTLILLTMTVFGVVTIAPYAHAQEQAESITLSPVSARFAIDAGKQKTGELTIVNDGKADYDFIVYSRPYSIPCSGTTCDYSQPDFVKTLANGNAYQWVRLPQAKFHAKSGETVKVPYSIDVPSTAAPGGHYGVIFAETQPPADQPATNSVIRKKRVGMIIYASVNGNFIEKGQAVSNTVDFWQLQPPLKATVTAKNDGNTDYLNTITFAVKDMFDNTKYSFVKQYPVLPQTSRVVPLEWAESPWFGLFKVEVQQKFLDQDLKTTSYVLMMPRLLPVVLLVLLLAGGGYAVYRRKKK